MTRFEDWPLRLSEFIASRREAAFSWGQNDCMIFCADAVKELTGADLAISWRGTYNSEESAASVMALWGDSIEDVLDGQLGERKPTSYAKRGDVVSFESSGKICGGIVDDTGRRAVFMMQNGLMQVPLSRCRWAWEV